MEAEDCQRLTAVSLLAHEMSYQARGSLSKIRLWCHQAQHKVTFVFEIEKMTWMNEGIGFL